MMDGSQGKQQCRNAFVFSDGAVKIIAVSYIHKK